jgi:uncharacterized protein (TIGR03084 family)
MNGRPPVSMPRLIADLAAETRDFTDLTDGLPDQAWQQPTPAPGWTIADQVSHLAYYDEAAVRAATDPPAFAMAAGDPDETGRRYHGWPADALRDWFSRARGTFLAVFAGLDPRARVPWYGPSMSAATMVTARVMETWAHGQDIADALGIDRLPTSRLRHVAHLAVAARDYSFANHGLPPPGVPIRVELTAPNGQLWTWGPADAAEHVAGPALDFCLVATRRRHPADTSLAASGPTASAWIAIAQAYAGPPGPGRGAGAAAGENL